MHYFCSQSSVAISLPHHLSLFHLETSKHFQDCSSQRSWCLSDKYSPRLLSNWKPLLFRRKEQRNRKHKVTALVLWPVGLHTLNFTSCQSRWLLVAWKYIQRGNWTDKRRRDNGKIGEFKPTRTSSESESYPWTQWWDKFLCISPRYWTSEGSYSTETRGYYSS